jgi:hypothetical protein
VNPGRLDEDHFVLGYREAIYKDLGYVTGFEVDL